MLFTSKVIEKTINSRSIDEENAFSDKSKKALVGITYELDNLLLKADILSKKFLTKGKQKVTEESSENLYFNQVLKEITTLYKLNKLKSISSQKLTTLKYAYNLLVLHYLKSTLKFNKNKSEV